ncbi:MAG: flagellar biosynthetic protein FliR [Bacillota bacterium]
MNLENFLVNNTYFFFLVFLRYLGIFLVTPMFSSDVILTRIKLGLTLVLTIVTFPVLQNLYSPEFPNHILSVAGSGIRELAVGFLIGFILLLIFTAIQLAGKLIDLRMGFRIANELDPLTGSSAPIVGQLKNILGILVFLGIDGHLLIIKNLFNSFETIQPGMVMLDNYSVLELVFRRSADLFIIGFQIALPIVGTVFMIDVLLGFLARSVPQMNIFIVGLPFKILVGFMVMYLSMNTLLYFYRGLFEQFFEDVLMLIEILG